VKLFLTGATTEKGDNGNEIFGKASTFKKLSSPDQENLIKHLKVRM
jgi:hypothetical protein